MEQIMEVIKRRASVRAYLDKPLPEEVIGSILEAAKHAPTARNLQELEYRVITNKALMQRASDTITAALAEQGQPMQPKYRPSFFYGAPLLILIIGPQDNHWIYSDAALSAQNIMLYATSINLGSCFIGMTRFMESDKNIMDELHIAEGLKIAAAVICGYPSEKPLPPEKKLNAEFFK